MNQESQDHSQTPNTVRIFFIVAIAVLAPLLLFARLASGAQHAESTAALPVIEPSVETSSVPAEDMTQRLVSHGAQLLSPPPDVGAESYVIVDRGCNDVIASRNPEERLPPASLTKIITAMVVRSRASLDDMVTIKVSGKKMAATTGSSVMGIEPSMQLSVRDLLYGMFLASGNDAAEALAQYVAGNDQQFAVLMNQTARQLHMDDTSFTNPHGLDDPNLYSSAYDMTEAGLALLNDPVLAQIIVTPQYQPNWKGDALKNGNQMLTHYPGSFGVKIGFTEKAHQTMVAAAQRDGRQIVVSLLHTDDRYSDAQTLLDWAFANSRSTC